MRRSTILVLLAALAVTGAPVTANAETPTSRPSGGAALAALALAANGREPDRLPPPGADSDIGGWGSHYLTNDEFDATANHDFAFGDPTDRMYIGDWDGNGTDTLAIRRGANFQLSNSQVGGRVHHLTYGRPGDEVYVGDWDGDGKDTFAVRRGNVFHLTNRFGGKAQTVFTYGRVGDTVIAGDWDGDGKDTFAVIRGEQVMVSNHFRGGKAQHVEPVAFDSDQTVVGDWDGDGRDSLGFRFGSTYRLNRGGAGGWTWGTPITVTYGRQTDSIMVGDWDGDGVDSLGVRRIRNGVYRDGPNTYRGLNNVSFSVGRITGLTILEVTCHYCMPLRLSTDNGLTARSTPTTKNLEEFGVRRYLMNPAGGITRSITISAKGRWSVKVIPAAEYLKRPRSSGSGYDDVLWLDGRPDREHGVTTMGAFWVSLDLYPQGGTPWSIPRASVWDTWPGFRGFIQVRGGPTTIGPRI